MKLSAKYRLAPLTGLLAGLLLSITLSACILEDDKEPPKRVEVSRLTLTGRLDSIQVADSSLLLYNGDSIWQSHHNRVFDDVLFPKPITQCKSDLYFGRQANDFPSRARSWGVGEETTTLVYEIHFGAPLDSAFTHYRFRIDCDNEF